MSRVSTLITPALENATVADAMRAGIISCPADTPVRAVAEMMARYHVHAVVVEGVPADPGHGWGIVSDMRLTRAAARDELDATAAELAYGPALTVTPDESLIRAAELMAEHGVSHLIVAASPTSRPAGIISTLDLAVVIAWGRD